MKTNIQIIENLTQAVKLFKQLQQNHIDAAKEYSHVIDEEEISEEASFFLRNGGSVEAYEEVIKVLSSVLMESIIEGDI